MQRNLVRFLTLNLIDNKQGRTGRAALEHKAARGVLGVIRPVQRWIIHTFGLGSQATALDLARHALYANAGFVVIALAILAAQMTVTDLTSRYVVHSTSVDLPLFFRITGTWAGSSGSLLFWYTLLTVFSAIVVYQTRARLFNRLPILFFSLAMLQLVFVLLTLFFKDAQPFRSYPAPMVSGRGLNPLLLHWAMIIHPPMLYIGYVSFAIPFALMISSVVSGNMKEDYMPLLRRWTIFSWFFLGTGILLGSKWAYEELGWGGYWAWDPVENASLMPFLLATAFLHSLIVQERRGMLRFWNVFLITLAYHFCLLGTWITRSGILQGPHTFAESSIGIPLIVFIGLSFTFYLRYLYFRRKALRPKERLEAVTSKEGSMLLNNFLMTLATMVVLFGVFSPLLPIDCSFDGGFACHKAEWKLNTFNKIMVPIGILTLFLMGASPLLSWRK
ncbi:MAG: cytochrome c biogenesis protein CcsA, partial [Spirochaetia bacterium]|nr:cytochrome c biogenesis protein CcsA [Spirochaetia bacterium]